MFPIPLITWSVYLLSAFLLVLCQVVFCSRCYVFLIALDYLPGTPHLFNVLLCKRCTPEFKPVLRVCIWGPHPAQL